MIWSLQTVVRCRCIRVRQFLEAGKTICLKSLAKFSNMTMKEIQTDIFIEPNNVDRIKAEAEALLLVLSKGLFNGKT